MLQGASLAPVMPCSTVARGLLRSGAGGAALACPACWHQSQVKMGAGSTNDLPAVTELPPSRARLRTFGSCYPGSPLATGHWRWGQ